MAQPYPNREPAKKIFYIDNLKILLTMLVVLHHTFITYGASGGWYYSQKTAKMGALIPMTMFVSINQAFFMGFFFFLAAYFIRPSFERKGSNRFVADRLLRLGVPLIFYSFILSPLLSYLVYYWGYGHHINYWQYLGGFHPWIDFGVLWFVAALLIFTLAYVVCRMTIKNYESIPMSAPSSGLIILFAAIVGVISFSVRNLFPVGWVLKPLGFQPGHFSQYIALYMMGLLASKNNWLGTLSGKTGKQMGLLAILLILFLPVFYIIKLNLDMPLEWYSGGFHWQSLLYAVWEQVTGFSIITALLVFGRETWNRSTPLLGRLSRSTFAVYIFHPLVVITLTLAVRNWNVDPVIKLLIVAPLAVIGSFLLGSLVLKIPGVKRVI